MTASRSSSPWPVDQARIDANWRAITIELDAPTPSRVERLLRAVGLPARVTRLVVATPALRRAWYDLWSATGQIETQLVASE